MLQELLNMTVDSQVTLPLCFTMAFVDMLDILAQESALLTNRMSGFHSFSAGMCTDFI
jgi:hypothetical protein